MKILLATDGSEYSEGAAKFLTRLNFTPDDEITVLHVISDIPFRDEDDMYYESLRKIKQEIAPRILDSTIDNLKPLNIKISTALTDGYPDIDIVNAAVASDVDLIVMGARGLKGIKSLLIGSAARSVAINSPKPVLVVKPPQYKTAGTLKILYATDGSIHAAEAGRLLTSMPFPDDTEIAVLNVVLSAHIDIPERFWIEVDSKIKEEVANIREIEFGRSNRIIKEASEILSSRFSKINVSIQFGDPSIEILNEAKKLNADIIAVGSSGMRGLKGMLGSISRSILGHSECSVLIGKNNI